MIAGLKDSVKELLQLFVPGKAQVTFLKVPAGIVIAAAGFFARGLLG